MKQRVLLCIMDGWGINKDGSKDAISAAKTPGFDKLISEEPHTMIYADGEHVGLPEGQMGNSEVGHLNLGAGRIVYQELSRINKSIKDGDFFENEEFLNAINHAKKNQSSLHLYGLVSDGGVHSSLNHLLALIELAAKEGLKNVYVHAFLDGRDTPPKSAKKYLQVVEDKLSECNLPAIASVIGRYWAMVPVVEDSPFICRFFLYIYTAFGLARLFKTLKGIFPVKRTDLRLRAYGPFRRGAFDYISVILQVK